MMLAEEIERQAARNSHAVLDMTAILLNERMTAKRWTGMDERMSRILARYETESHGGVWPPPTAVREEEPELILSTNDEHPTSPLQPISSTHVTAFVPPPLPSPAPEEKKKSIRVKVKGKKNRTH